jgi:hypothetical protein
MQNSRVSHFLHLHIFEARLAATDSNRVFVRRKIRSGGHGWGKFCSLTPDTKYNDAGCTEILPLWEQAPLPAAPCKFTVPTVNRTDSLTSRYMTTIHTHILLAMLLAASSKECTVYCFMAEGSCVRIPLEKWVLSWSQADTSFRFSTVPVHKPWTGLVCSAEQNLYCKADCISINYEISHS